MSQPPGLKAFQNSNQCSALSRNKTPTIASGHLVGGLSAADCIGRMMATMIGTIVKATTCWVILVWVILDILVWVILEW